MEIAVWIIALSQIALFIAYLANWNRHFGYQERAEARQREADFEAAKDKIKYLTAAQAYDKGREDERKENKPSQIVSKDEPSR